MSMEIYHSLTFYNKYQTSHHQKQPRKTPSCAKPRRQKTESNHK